MDLKVNQSRVVHSHNIFTNFNQHILVSKTNWRLKVLWLAWCSIPPLQSLAGYWRYQFRVYILIPKTLRQSYAHGYLRVSTALGFRIVSEVSKAPIPMVSFSTLPQSSPHLILPVPIPKPIHTQLTFPMDLVCLFWFLFLVRIMCPQWSHPCYLGPLGLWIIIWLLL